MRALDKDHKLQAESLPELPRGLVDERNRLKKLGHRKSIYGKPLRPTHVLNAWVAAILDSSPEERDRLFARGNAIFGDHARSDEPIYWNVEEEPAPPVEEPGRKDGSGGDAKVVGNKGLTPRGTGKSGGQRKAGRKHESVAAIDAPPHVS